MESKDEIKRSNLVTDAPYPYQRTDREVVELFQLFKMIRKHSTKLEWESADNDREKDCPGS